MKLLVLYTRLSGYTAACLRAFRDRSGAELLIYAWPNQKNAPFDVEVFSDIGEINSRVDVTVADIERSLDAFKPDAVLVSGWSDKGYVKICRKLKARGIPVISGCDTQRTGSARQRVAGMIAPWYVQRFIDVLWVTGERQRQFAARLGYAGASCWDGYYACDWNAFARRREQVECVSSKPKFLFVGRYAPEKGLDTLAMAYRAYCQQVQAPWPLVCAGVGSLRNVVLEAGAEDRGFVQPADLPDLMHEAAAFVLPSQFEPWGVVVQEAAASHLPLILSTACGAGDHLLRPHYNGFNFEAGSVAGLTRALTAMHELTQVEREEYAKTSFELSSQYTPERWAETLTNGLVAL